MKVQQERQNDNGMTVYISNMSYKKDKEAVKRLFSKYGKVKSIEVIKDPKTKKSKGYAFVKMYKSVDALNAIKVLDGKILDNRTLKASVAKERKGSKTSFEPPKEKTPKAEKITKSPPKKRARKTSGLNSLFNFLSTKK